MALLIPWSNELSVGIEEIDEQHKVLVALLNEMNAATQERLGQDKAAEVLSKLIEYARIHFAVEESLMRILNYPAYEDHKMRHQNLMRNALDLIQKAENGKLSVGIELQFFLKNWLTKHIQESDKRYTEHFLKTGAHAKLKKLSWIARLWE